MKIEELAPLLEKIAPLAHSEETNDIYKSVYDAIAAANTPSMAQSVCSHVITMYHPKAWGDQYFTIFGPGMLSWNTYLGELSEVANECGQKIHENYRGIG